MNQSLELWRNLNPLRDLSMLHRNLDRIFDDFQPMNNKHTKFNFHPACEILEDPNHYILRFEIPGMKKEDIKIELHENTIRVAGEKRREKSEASSNLKHHYSELEYGSFARSFTLPTSINAEKVHAIYEEGILTITLNKSESSKLRQINVK